MSPRVGKDPVFDQFCTQFFSLKNFKTKCNISAKKANVDGPDEVGYWKRECANA